MLLQSLLGFQSPQASVDVVSEFFFAPEVEKGMMVDFFRNRVVFFYRYLISVLSRIPALLR
jgi:hypothetical protein